MRLPPPGSNPADIMAYCDAIVWESASDFRRRKCEWDWSRALQLMFCEHYPEDMPINEQGRIRMVVNRIVRVVMSMMVIQAGDPPDVKISSRETGSPPRYFLKQPPLMTPNGPINQPSQEIDEATAQMMQQQRQQQQFMVDQTQANGAFAPKLPPDPLIEISDTSCCDALKDVLDVMDDDCGFQFIFRENVYYKLQFGNAPTLYEFDQASKKHLISNAPPTHVFYQRNVADMRRNSYGVYDEYCSADDGIAFAAQRMTIDEYQKAKEGIAAFWTQGAPIVPGAQPYAKSAMFNQIFKRTGGFIRHCWIQNQPYPMTIEEALYRGKVEKKQVQIQVPSGAGQLPQSQAGGPSPEYGAAVAQQPTGGATPLGPTSGPGPAGTDGVLGAAGKPVDAPADALAQSENANQDDLSEYMLEPPPTRSAYVLKGSNIEVTPPTNEGVNTHPLWPVTTAIRQIVYIGHTLVNDKRAKFNRVPLPNNVNIPIPFSPLGMGECKILEDLQKAINLFLSQMISLGAYYSVPPEVILKEICDGLEEPLKNARLKYGEKLKIAKANIPDGWKLPDCIMHLPAPVLPADFWKMLDFLITMMDKEGNQADVASGNAAPGWSGEAISSLQNAHNQLVRASGLSTEDWLRDLTELKINSIVHLMSPEDCARICRKYPIEVWQVLHERFRDLNPIISVRIGSASEQAKAAQTQALIVAKQAGVGIPDSAIHEGLNLDPDEIAQELSNQARIQAQNQPQQQPVAAKKPQKAEQTQ